ncbi:MAG: Hpt domain-containing protein [Candidatus Omnitrophica bacterium]|nr:Hpt domain-containing protein [Candidatus Omnitrophota bacterium]
MSNEDIIDQDIIREFIDDMKHKLANLEDLIGSLTPNQVDKSSVDEIFRSLHTIKGTSSIFGYMKIKSLAHVMEDILMMIRDGNINITESLVCDFLSGLDCLSHIVTNIQKSGEELESENGYRDCLERISSYIP